MMALAIELNDGTLLCASASTARQLLRSSWCKYDRSTGGSEEIRLVFGSLNDGVRVDLFSGHLPKMGQRSAVGTKMKCSYTKIEEIFAIQSSSACILLGWTESYYLCDCRSSGRRGP